MRMLIAALLLIVTLPGHGQVITIGARPAELEVLKARKLVSDAGEDRGTLTVGSQYTTSELAAARKTLEDAAPKKLAIQAGEFEVVEPSQTVTVPLLWVVTDDTLLQRVTIPANTPFSIWMTRRGDAGPKFHQFKAQPFDWVILVGIKNGFTAIQIVRNGETSKDAPYIVDRIDATVGENKPQPPPAPPIDDPLTKAFRAAAQQDAVVGKADRKHLLPLAGIYEAAAADELTRIKTFGELDAQIAAAVTAAGIPSVEQQFPSLRKAIQQEIFARLNINEGSGNQTITDDTKRLARSCFLKIASALEDIAK